MPAAKKPKLTIREQKLIKGVVAGKTKRQAAIEAGYTGKPETVSVTASEVLKKPNVQEALQLALEKHNITPDRVIARVSEAMDAERVVIIGKDEDAFADVQPDHSIRLKAAGMAANFMGIGKDNSSTVNINFNQIMKEHQDRYAD